MKDPIHIVSINVILKYRNQYLLIQRNKKDMIFPCKWQNLGGKVEIGERLEDALIRECYEETKIKIHNNLHPFFIMSYSWTRDHDPMTRMGVVFMYKLTIKQKNIKLSNEHEDYGWFTFNQAKKLETIGMESKGGTIAQLKKTEKLSL
jgi:8-oxo-dGTP diphosphatase